MKKILVTGANGQLGTEIQKLEYRYSGFEFLNHDIDTLDLSDFEGLENFLLEKSPAYILNCAAYTAVDKAQEDEENATLLNVNVPTKLAQLATKIKAVLIHISTDYVFDGKTFLPYKEDSLVNPESIYGITKAKGEKAVMEAGNHIIVRTSWLYSSHGNNFLKTILRLSNERDELGVIFDQIGTPTYAGDLAQALLTIIEKLENSNTPSPFGIYHYSNEGVCSWYDFAREIVNLTDAVCRVKPITSDEYPLPAPRPFYSVLNKTKIKRNFNIEIPYWRDSVKNCIKELKAI